MDRAEIRNKIVTYFRQQVAAATDPSRRPQIQMGFLGELFKDTNKDLPGWKQNDVLSSAREIIHEFMNIGAIYPGGYGQIFGSDFYPWLTITEHGKEVFSQENWLPYDPEGYLKALKEKVPEIDDATFTYIGESISSFNNRHLLSATLTLGVASENLMILLIETYSNFLKDPKRKASFDKKIEDKWISTQYKEFRKEFSADVKSLPKELQGDVDTYLDGIFNFIRINRNDAGHPTGKAQGVKVVYANLQIFADYTRYIFDLINYLKK